MTSPLRVQWIVDGIVGNEQEGWRSSLASNRYRVLAPCQALRDRGLNVSLLPLASWDAAAQTVGEADIVAIGKIAPGGDAARVKSLCDRMIEQLGIARASGTKVVADFNDDHFDRPVVGSYWRSLARSVDVCVAGSPAMASRLKGLTSVSVQVIGDPALAAASAPRVFRGDGFFARAAQGLFKRPPGRLRLLWFGNLNNWPALLPWAESLVPLARSQPWRLDVLTTSHPPVRQAIEQFNQRHGPTASMQFVEWSEAAQAELLATSHVVLLPSDTRDVTKSIKTANRLADALQAGNFVLASALPAYQPFEAVAALGEHPLLALRAYLTDPHAAQARIREGQALVRQQASIDACATGWERVFAATRSTPGEEEVWRPRRLLVLSSYRNFTLELKLRLPLRLLIEAQSLRMETVTEDDLLTRFGADAAGAEAWRWLEGEAREFEPDCLVFCRYAGPHTASLLQWARQRGVPTVLHLDDDLLSVPLAFGDQKYRFHHQPTRTAALRLLLDGVDVVHSGSAGLTARLTNHHHVTNRIATAVIPMGAPIVADAQLRDVRKIGYMGSQDHAADLAMVAPALLRLLSERQDIEFEVFGDVPLPEELRAVEVAGRVLCTPAEHDHAKFQARFSSLRWDIGLCPLELTEFNSAKTALKWVEYTRIGAATVASAGTVYDACCADAAGVLVERPEDWYEALLVLIDHPERRYEIALSAQAKSRAQYTEAIIREDLLAVLTEAAQRRQLAQQADVLRQASMAAQSVRLNLGCGDKILPDYVNVDVVEARAGRSPDVICDLRSLQPFDDDSADEVMAIHVVEHFWRWEIAEVLREWVRVLRPGGRMVLECPNLLSACQDLLAEPESRSRSDVHGQRTMWVFYGDPAWQDPLMIHRWGYTPHSLSELMREVGLIDVHQEPAQYKLREPRDMRVVGVKPL